ncbi:putative ubiquitin-conjugating enzyme E2 23 [Bienertia sinuspersici]
MGTDQSDALDAIEGTTRVSGDLLLIGGINVEGNSNCDDKNGGSPLIVKPESNKHIYRQDVVRCNDGSMIGVVTEVAGDSDSESESGITDDEDEDEDDKEEEEEGKEEGEGEKRGQGKEEDSNVENEGGDKFKDGVGNESSDDDKSAGNNKRDPLTGDQVRVLWMDDSEKMHHRNELTVVDRGFLHGDYVASSLDPTGQVGLVVDVNITVDLLTNDGNVVKDVSAKDLKRVRDIVVGDYVVSGPWLGRVDDVLDNVTVLFDDGSVCKVSRAEPMRLRPIAKNLLEDGHCPYHPGQRVRASSSSIFKNARWLSGSWKANRLEGTVKKLLRAMDLTLYFSTRRAESKELKILGDWCLHPTLALSSSIPLDKSLSKLRLYESGSGVPESDVDELVTEESNVPVELRDLDVASTSETVDGNAQNNASPKSSSCGSSLSISKDTVHESWNNHRKKLRKVVVKRDKKARKKEENFERALLIVNTKTTVDVAWQDGTVQRGLDSTLLIPIESPGDHDFVAEQYVVEKAADDGEETTEIRRVGVVKSVDAKEKTACVKWLKQVSRPEDPRQFEKEEVVSVYELEGHPDYDYCYGDVVVRLSPVFMAAELACSDPKEKSRMSNAPNRGKGESETNSNDKKGELSDDASCNELSNLSWVGNITGLKNGDIEVTWADGMVSTVGPQAVYVVGRDDDDSIVAGSEISDDAASWETVEDDEMDALDNTEKELPSEGTEVHPDAGEDIVVTEHDSGNNGPLAFPLAAIGFVTRFASGIFSRDNTSEDNKDISYERTSSNVSNSQDSSVIDTVGGQTNLDNGEGPAEVESAKCSQMAEALGGLNPKEELLFSVLTEISAASSALILLKIQWIIFFLSNSGRKWLKKVQRDWNILQNNLPDGIYVRVYEDRMDLLRAVIVGAYGTPYQDGLFFFDFYLPPEYPDVPPDFEDLVKEHFRQRGCYILKACDAYMKGFLIGSLAKDASMTEKSEANATSVGFKLMLAKIVPKLISSLSEIGVDCDEFKHMLQS